MSFWCTWSGSCSGWRALIKVLKVKADLTFEKTTYNPLEKTLAKC